MNSIIITADAVELNILLKIREDYSEIFHHVKLYYGFWHAIANYLAQFYKS